MRSVTKRQKMNQVKVLIALFVVFTTASALVKPLIFGGERATEGQFPYLMSFRSKAESVFHHICGAAIISERFAVTAGHCFSSSNGLENYRIVVGAYDREDFKNGKYFKIKQFIRHPGYNSTTKINDIALIEFKKSIRFDENIKVLEIGTTFIEDGEVATIAGWGRSEVCE